jgi:hypothetical protein
MRVTEIFIAVMVVFITTICFSYEMQAQPQDIQIEYIEDSEVFICTLTDTSNFAIVLEVDGGSYMAFRGVSDEFLDGHSVFYNNCTGEKTLMPNREYASYDHSKGVLYIQLSTDFDATFDIIEYNLSILSIVSPSMLESVQLEMDNLSLSLQQILNKICPKCRIPEPKCN